VFVRQINLNQFFQAFYMEEKKLSLEDVVDALVISLKPKPYNIEEKKLIIDDFLTILQRKGLVTSEEIFKTEEAYLKKLEEAVD
jgi:hypothetical protein